MYSWLWPVRVVLLVDSARSVSIQMSIDSLVQNMADKCSKWLKNPSNLNKQRF